MEARSLKKKNNFWYEQTVSVTNEILGSNTALVPKVYNEINSCGTEDK